MKRSGSFVTILACFFLAATVAAQGDISGLVYQTANVRSGPDTRFAIVAQLSAGDRVQIDGRDAESRWLHVILPTATTGWLPTFALILDGNLTDVPLFQEAESTPSPQATVSVISYGRVNVRSGPGINYAVVGQLDVSDQAQALARSNSANDWLMIHLGSAEGWVAYFTVNVLGDPATLPILVPDSSGQSLIPPSRLLHARFNARLHQTATLDSPVIETVPFDSDVTPLGRSADGNWLFVGYKDLSGWGVSQLFDITSADIQQLPVYEPGQPVPTPEATAQS